MKKILSAAIGLLMVLTLFPVGAAALGDAVEIAGLSLEDGYYLPSISGEPAPMGEGTPSSYVAMYQDGVLTLKDLEIPECVSSSGIYSANNLTVVLMGDNVIGSKSHHPSEAAIRSLGILTIQGSGSLEAYGDYEALNGYTGVDIKSGTLKLYAQYPIDAYDNNTPDVNDYDCSPLTISGGTILADGLYCGFYCGDATISGGKISVNGEDEGIYANGALTVSGGSVTVNGEEEGIHVDGALTFSDGFIAINGEEKGIYTKNTLTVTGGTVTVTGRGIAVWATDIVLGSGVPIRAGGTARVVSVYTCSELEINYYKVAAEESQTIYYQESTETTENACPEFPETESYHYSTFASGDDLYYDLWMSTFVNASTRVVLGSAGSAKKTVRDDDEPVITGKITSYEELSRLSADYKAMKEYAQTLGLGDFQVIGTWDVETKGYGPWEIVFHLDAKYLGDTLTIIHKKDDGTFETFTAVVDKSGEATISVTSASPFLVVRGEASGSTTGGTASVTEENPDTGLGFAWWF